MLLAAFQRLDGVLALGSIAHRADDQMAVGAALDQIILRAFPDGSRGEGFVIQPAEHDDGNGGSVSVRPGDGGESLLVGKRKIEENDVKCSHASAVGPIDEEQRYYLESRGIPPQIAERLIVLGFFSEVLERLPSLSLATRLRDRLAVRLGGGA